LWVDQGKAEVSVEGKAAPIVVEQGMEVPLAAVLVPEQSLNEPADQLRDWSKGRSDSVSADNAIAAQISDDPISAENSASALGASGLGTLTYFPLLGLAPLGLSGPYNSFAPYQPGFSSIYLPGYRYQPFFLGLRMGGYRRPPYLPAGIAIRPRPGPPLPGSMVIRVPVPHPAPIHPVARPHGGMHGIHR
jgi:hypothetical protein